MQLKWFWLFRQAYLWISAIFVSSSHATPTLKQCAPDLTIIISEIAGRTEGRKRRSRWWIRHQFLFQMSLILLYPKGLLEHMAVLRNRSLPSLSIIYLLSSPCNLISAFQIWLWTLFRIVESQTLSILILSIFISTRFVL